MAGLLPGPWAWKLSRIEPYGLMIMVGLMVTGMLGKILGPPLHMFESLLFSLAGVS